MRLKTPLKVLKIENNPTQISFEHIIEMNEEEIYFAFTYPYSYTVIQDELNQIMEAYDHEKLHNSDNEDDIIVNRELLVHSCDNRQIDLITITSKFGISDERELRIDGLFPDHHSIYNPRPFIFPNKQVVFVSARVHPGEVPAQHTFKGIMNLLLDKNDIRAKELRKRYVFKLIPCLNPDGKCLSLLLRLFLLTMLFR